METLGTSALVPFCVGISLVGALIWALNLMHKRGVRRYEQVVDNAFVECFEQRAIVARSLHPNLAQTIQRTKSVVDRVRAKFPDGPETEAALNQVSEWLEGAAGESDRALRSLESSPTTSFHHGYVGRGSYVDRKTNSHHDR
jgi:signal transduction histidine kinase